MARAPSATATTVQVRVWRNGVYHDLADCVPLRPRDEMQLRVEVPDGTYEATSEIEGDGVTDEDAGVWSIVRPLFRSHDWTAPTSLGLGANCLRNCAGVR